VHAATCFSGDTDTEGTGNGSNGACLARAARAGRLFQLQRQPASADAYHRGGPIRFGRNLPGRCRPALLTRVVTRRRCVSVLCHCEARRAEAISSGKAHEQSERPFCRDCCRPVGLAITWTGGAPCFLLVDHPRGWPLPRRPTRAGRNIAAPALVTRHGGVGPVMLPR
jgi:hypothetical protein